MAGEREKLGFIISALDLYLGMGVDPVAALHDVIQDYAYVFHHDDGRLPLNRAAEIALRRMEAADTTSGG